jgi:hypothetical protein
MRGFRATRHAAKLCACGKEIDAATPAAGDGQPSAGDFTFCIYCARLYRFSTSLELVPLSVSDFERSTDLDAEQKADIRRMQRKIISKQRIPS